MTRAATMGPVADLVRRCGGRPELLFRKHGLSLRYAEDPERLLLLRDQSTLVESAARSVGDVALGARLSTTVGFAGLGGFARQVDAGRTLGDVLARANSSIGAGLQSGTVLRLERAGAYARWTYRVTERLDAGRGQNEQLAVGFQLDLLRQFAGPHWVPVRLQLPEASRAVRAAVAAVFRCDIVPGDVAGIVFPAALLDRPRPGRADGAVEPPRDEVPDAGDLVACAEHVLAGALLEGRPSLAQLVERLQIPARTLQRRLAEHGESFDSLLQRTLRRRADSLLDAGASVTETATELGYSDTAHFSRAYRGWTGRPPSRRAG